MKTVITFGTYDLFHVGHLRILERASTMGDRLIVGVSSDELNFRKKKRKTVYSESERVEIIEALSCVDNVFLEESLEMKEEYIKNNNADILVMGDDWVGKFDFCKVGNPNLEVIYLPRTPDISTSELLSKIKIN